MGYLICMQLKLHSSGILKPLGRNKKSHCSSKLILFFPFQPSMPFTCQVLRVGRKLSAGSIWNQESDPYTWNCFLICTSWSPSIMTNLTGFSAGMGICYLNIKFVLYQIIYIFRLKDQFAILLLGKLLLCSNLNITFF